MDSNAVQPLRISKTHSAATTPSKMPVATSRPLAEIGSTERRRNSPSYNQATKKMILADSSPYTENSSPPSLLKQSKDFWTQRDAMSPSRFDENSPAPEASPHPTSLSGSPKRRPSVERLFQTGRVKNSNIFALENRDAYDPAVVPIVERPVINRPPIASGINRFDQSPKKENNPYRTHKRAESQTDFPILAPTSPMTIPLPTSPEKREVRSSPAPGSPTKSSLRNTNCFPPSPGPGEISAAGTPRHSKSVMFNAAPPEVNEYEEQTPEPSSIASREGSWDSEDFDDSITYERGSSAEQDQDSFDADLENAWKTPVVLPEEWSRMSPAEARTELVGNGDDVFGTRAASDGEARPLPPLPGAESLNSTAERVAQAATRSPLHVKAPSVSKDEILSMGRPIAPSVLTQPTPSAEEAPVVEVEVKEVEQDSIIADLDEQDFKAPKISRESILRKVRGSKYDFEDFEDEDEEEAAERPTIEEMARMDPDQPIPSRENSRDISDTFQPHASSNDVVNASEVFEEVEIKDEPVDEDVDLNSIPALPEAPPAKSTEPEDRQTSVIRHRAVSEQTDDTSTSSRYSSAEPEMDADCSVIHHPSQLTTEDEKEDEGKESLQDAMQLLTVQDFSPRGANASAEANTKQGGLEFLGLPTYLASDLEWNFGMEDFLSGGSASSFSSQEAVPTPPVVVEAEREVVVPEKKLEETKMPVLQPAIEFAREVTPAAAVTQAENSEKEIENGTEPEPEPELDISPPPTPNSVIRHDDAPASPLEEKASFEYVEPEQIEEPPVPERVASIKTPGSKLKARPSATPADLAAMAEQRRVVSGQEHSEAAMESLDETADTGSSNYSAEEEKDTTTFEKKRKSRKSGGRMDFSSFLDTSTFTLGEEEDEGAGLGLDEDFDRVIEAQKKGYLMRQNTKVVVATTRNISGESSETTQTSTTNGDGSRPSTGTSTERPNSRARTGKSVTRKASEEQFLKTEPWNGKIRRQSIRLASAQKDFRSDPAPPLPGMESALGVVNEDADVGALDEVSDGGERGRLFVKVVGVRDLELPLPKNDRVYFQLTLDNGLHCVTTMNLELGKNAQIGQEFELVVLNDLEFQLTLTTKLPPASQTTRPESSGSGTSPTKSPTKPKAGFSRFLSSPKKRAEKERAERQAAEAEEKRLQEEAKKRSSQPITAWDLLRELVNESDGSFARAYVNLEAHEQSCFGRQFTVDVPCYNEWALEKDADVVNSVRSKRAKSGTVRRPPYVIGHLQLQLFYVPKPKTASDEDMPKSMSAAMREMKKAGETEEMVHEGHLSQQGGDCTHWRRRFFRLQGSKLTAYHEHTHQKRAVINLSKASRLVDDKRMLTADISPVKPGKNRRKSAFAEEDEAYQYVEEGFRMRFANGETIDFYADTKARKDEWMVALSHVIGRPDTSQKAATWTDLVLAREKKARPDSAGSVCAPSSPAKSDVRDFGRTSPTKELGRVSPTKDLGRASPTKELGRTSPTKDLGRLSPTKELGRASPTKELGRLSPTKELGRSSPTKELGRVSPTKDLQDSKSVPSSPTKAARTAPLPPAAGPLARPSTPPMSPRQGHRSRYNVKSMIF